MLLLSKDSILLPVFPYNLFSSEKCPNALLFENYLHMPWLVLQPINTVVIYCMASFSVKLLTAFALTEKSLYIKKKKKSDFKSRITSRHSTKY